MKNWIFTALLGCTLIAYGCQNPMSSSPSTPGTGNSLTLSATSLTIALNEIESLTASMDVTWNSSDSTVVTVADGVLTPVAVGTATITATSVSGGKTATCAVTITTAKTGSSGTGSTPANTLWFAKQALADTVNPTTAILSGGTISVHNTYSATGNAFKWSSANVNYGNFNGFLAFPTKFTGDFSLSADVTVTVQNKASNASGIGLGLFSDFGVDSTYSFMLMRNSNNQAVMYYTKTTDGTNSSSVGTTGTAITYTAGTTMTLSLRRVGTTLYWNANTVGSTTNDEQSNVVSNFLGAGSTVYAGISFANVDATVTNLVIKDAEGNEVFNSSTGGLEPVTPASLTLSQSSFDMLLGQSGSLTATAIAFGGAVSAVSYSVDDSSILSFTKVVTGSTGTSFAFKGIKAGTANVTVTNLADNTKTATFAVTVNDYASADSYGTLPAGTLFPAPAATGVYPDGELALTFDAVPTLNQGGSIRILKADGSTADIIGFADETQTAWSTQLKVADQLVRKDGNTLRIIPHWDALDYDTDYYVAIPSNAITGTLNGAEFVGFSNLSTVATWHFRTRSAPSLNVANITVDPSEASSADFRSLQAALSSLKDAFGDGTASPVDVTINLAAGTYHELIYYKGGHSLRIQGPSNTKGNTCTFEWVNGTAWNGSTHTRAAFYVSNSNLVLRNLSITNKAVRTALAQAEAIYFANGTTKTFSAANCTFSSNQDTIQTSGKTWFYNCHVEGNVDFIWGTADAALFENCSLRVVNDGAMSGSDGYSMVVARTGTTIPSATAGTVGKGFVIKECTVVLDDGVVAYLGRDAGTGSFYDQVAFINVDFTGSTGTIGTGRWQVKTVPLSLRSSPSYVGWKAVGVTYNGADLDTIPIATASGTSATIADLATEYDTRDHILNRVVTVDAADVLGFADAVSTWDISALESELGL